MSVDIADFEAGAAGGRTNAERVLAFLAAHDGRAWKAAAIAERAGVDPNSISAVLGRLEARGLVRHDRPYWAITDDEERVREAVRREEGPVEALVDLLPEPLEDLID